MKSKKITTKKIEVDVLPKYKPKSMDLVTVEEFREFGLVVNKFLTDTKLIERFRGIEGQFFVIDLLKEINDCIFENYNSFLAVVAWVCDINLEELKKLTMNEGKDLFNVTLDFLEESYILGFFVRTASIFPSLIKG